MCDGLDLLQNILVTFTSIKLIVQIIAQKRVLVLVCIAFDFAFRLDIFSTRIIDRLDFVKRSSLSLLGNELKKIEP